MSMGIHYIVLSDVHLGANSSILTRLAVGQTVADTHLASPALLSLVDACGLWSPTATNPASRRLSSQPATSSISPSHRPFCRVTTII
jgi:hypothetical protein